MFGIGCLSVVEELRKTVVCIHLRRKSKRFADDSASVTRAKHPAAAATVWGMHLAVEPRGKELGATRSRHEHALLGRQIAHLDNDSCHVTDS